MSNPISIISPNQNRNVRAPSPLRSMSHTISPSQWHSNEGFDSFEADSKPEHIIPTDTHTQTNTPTPTQTERQSNDPIVGSPVLLTVDEADSPAGKTEVNDGAGTNTTPHHRSKRTSPRPQSLHKSSSSKLGVERQYSSPLLLPKLKKNFSLSNLGSRLNRSHSERNLESNYQSAKRKENASHTNLPSLNKHESETSTTSLNTHPSTPSAPLKEHLYNLATFTKAIFSRHKESACDVITTLASEPGFHFDISQFTQIKQIGSGAYGRVILCRHSLTNKKVVLKVVDKSVINGKHLKHLLDEKETMKEISVHSAPFCVKTIAAFQDSTYFYFVMEHVPGGEIFAHLQAAPNHRFGDKRARFYICEVILALRHLHEQGGVVYRDIKPENLLVDSKGHVKLIDFGFAKKLGIVEKTFTICGTPDYLAPEMIQGQGYGREADYWAVGVLTFELLCGFPPFVTLNPRTGRANFSDVKQSRFKIPGWVTPAAQDFIVSLLVADADSRLGHSGGFEAIMGHEWFRGVDWDKVLRMEVKPPKPMSRIKHGLVNLQNEIQIKETENTPQKKFEGFDFILQADGNVSESIPIQKPKIEPVPSIVEEDEGLHSSPRKSKVTLASGASGTTSSSDSLIVGGITLKSPADKISQTPATIAEIS